MATKSEKDDAAKKAADDKQQAGERFTKERLEADCAKLEGNVAALEQQLARAQSAVVQLQGRINATVGALSYCQELLGAYGVAPKPIAETKPVERPQRKPRKVQSLPNGSVPAATSGSEAPQVE